MEATALRRLTLREREERPEAELQNLRPLGEAYLLRRFGGSLGRADAEDAVSEVVIRLHRRIELGKAPKNLRAAFFTSVRNAAIDQLRSRSAKPTAPLELVTESPAEAPTPIEAAESHEASIRLQEALDRMRPNYREAILLRFGADLTVPEIAERLQISLPAAKKLVLRSTAQVRKRLAAIEGEEFCPGMRDLARRSLFDKEAAGLASESEQRILHAHFQHCGSCKSFLAGLHSGLHELGGTALVAAATGEGIDRHLGLAGHLSRWLGHATDTAQAATGKVRLAAFKASGGLQGGDAATAGALSGTAQKIAAVCGAATATTATCLATGIVGPGLGATAIQQSPSQGEKPPVPIVKSVAEEPSPALTPTAPEPEPAPTAEPASEPATSAQQPPESPPPPSEPSPSEAASEEFGFESSAASESTPEAAPPPAPASAAPSPPPASSGSNSGGGGGGEKFGFGG